MGHLTLTTPLLRMICRHYAGTYIFYLCAKFDHPSFGRSGDMIGVHRNLNGSRDLTTARLGKICYPWDSTCYDQHVYQI